MITESTIYWVTRLDSIHTMFSIMFLVSFLTAFGVFLYMLYLRIAEERRGACGLAAPLTGLLIAVLVSVLGLVFVPHTKEYAAMKIIPAIVNSKEISEVPGDLKELYRLAIDGIKEELEGKAK